MPWIHLVTERSDHPCKRPDIGNAAVGSIWKCDDCGRSWQVERVVKIDAIASVEGLASGNFAKGGYIPQRRHIAELGPKFWVRHG